MIVRINAGKSFRGAAAYYLHDKARSATLAKSEKPKTTERVAWVETLNSASDDARRAADEMWRTHRDADTLKKLAGLKRGGRPCDRPVKTIALAWHTSENPGRHAMREAADAYLEAMGWDEHQAIIVCHTDTAHPHIHIILNRVHPVTGRVLDDGNDRPRAQAWALQYELTHGRIFCTARAVQDEQQAEVLEAARNQRNAALARPIVTSASRLAARRDHVVSTAVAATGLSSEQRQAATRMLTGGDLVAITGYAGTGKTRLIAQARRSWESQGYRVRGAALSGIAARNLEDGSGITSRTIASLEHAWGRGRDRLTHNDILVVDEAGMVSTAQMQRLIDSTERAGAKLVLIGDPEQLQPIEGPAAFRAITGAVETAALTEVRRQSSAWQQQATRELASRDTARALERYKSLDMVHEAATPTAARAALIERWDVARLAEPHVDRVILAYRRADVAKLNAMARAKARQGSPNLEHLITTAAGEMLLAVGEPVVFTRNDAALDVRNGTRGTVTALTPYRLTAAIRDGEQTRTVTVPLADYNHIQHGYAMTVHKAQGITVDAAHVLATRHYDRHIAYVAMTRHRDRLDLHYAKSDIGGEEQLATRLARAPLPTNLSRNQAMDPDLFCLERTKRDYAHDARVRNRGSGAGHHRNDHPAIQASTIAFTAAEDRIATLAATELPVGPRAERDALNSRHEAERDAFFADRRLFVKALREEVYHRTLTEHRAAWREHHHTAGDIRFASHERHELAAARTELREQGADQAVLRLDRRADMRADADRQIAEDYRTRDQLLRLAVRHRQDAACAAFINERYSDYQGLKDRQQSERRELKQLQALRTAGAWHDRARLAALTSPHVPQPTDVEATAARINAILDRLDIIMADSEHEALRSKQIEQAAAAYRKLIGDAGRLHDAEQNLGPIENDPQRKARLEVHAQEYEQARTAGTESDLDVEQRRREAMAAAAREEEARRIKQVQDEAEARRRAETAVHYTDPSQRETAALAKHYDILRPYQTLAQAAMTEHTAFLDERRQAAKAIHAEQDPERRQILILADEANVAAYQAHLAKRSAVMSEVITGRFANPNTLFDRMEKHDRFYEAMRAEQQLDGRIGNVQAAADYAMAVRQRTRERELREELRERTIAYERRKLGGSEQHAAWTQRTSADTAQNEARDVGGWTRDAKGFRDREEREKRHFRVAGNEASRQQDTQADRTQMQEERERQSQHHGRRR